MCFTFCSSTMEDSNDEKMNIYFRLMKTIPLEVMKSDTIRKIRTEFSELEGVSLVNMKSLFFAGDWLENDKKVLDYDIKNGSIINIYMDSGFRTQVYVKISQNNKRITLDVDMRDTIIAVKQRIQHKEGVTVSQQDLIYLGEQLNDSRTLASYNIRENSTIYAVFRDRDDIEINVSFKKQTISLKVKNWYTIGNVKSITESMVGIPTKKHKLYLGTVKLEDHETLVGLNVTQGQTLTLNSIYGMQIFVKKQHTDEVLTLEVDQSLTIADVKKLIEEVDGFHINKQKLIFSGIQLEDSFTLADYNIQHESLLHLVLRLCGFFIF